MLWFSHTTKRKETRMSDLSRERWLENAVTAVTPLFEEIGIELPKVRVSVGWPSKGGMSKNKTIGQCWKTTVATDNISQIFISPVLGETTLKVLATLVHELIHAWDDCKSGHKGEFARAAKSIGLQGPMTATEVAADSELGIKLNKLIEALGVFRHTALVVSEMDKQRKPQTTRMIKLVTPGCCDYTVRTTQKWINEGLPKCPHDVEMEVE